MTITSNKLFYGTSAVIFIFNI